MCCGMTGPQIGAPLEEQDMAALSLAAQACLKAFFEQAEQELENAEGRGEQQPFVPSQDLREKHARAVTEFNASIYCPVRQLEIIFDFSPPN